MVKEEHLAERDSAEFYREQVARLMKLAETMSDPASRLELLDIATVFHKMADRMAAPAALTVVPSKSA